MSIEEIITGIEYIAGVYFPESLEGTPNERHRRVLLEAITLLKTHPEAQPNEPHSRPTDFHVNDDMFGTHVKIPTGTSGDLHVYKVIGRIESNGYCDTPIMGGSNSVWHEEIVPVLNVVHCGVSEDTIVRVALSDCEIIQQPNEPLTEEELLEMDGEAVYLAADHKWYIVSLKFPGPWGNNVPCGVDMWGAGTSLSLLARCGVYLRPPKED